MSMVEVRIIGIDLPGSRHGTVDSLHVGLEHGKERESIVRADAERVRFDFTVAFVDGDFRGPYVTGKRGDRFVRLTWETVDDKDEWTMVGRTKIHLTGHEDLASEAVETGRRLEATVSLTGAKGGPAFATVRPETIQWRVV